MEKKTLNLPLEEGTLRIDIDIYGRSKCYLVEGMEPVYLGAGLIEKIARPILARLEGEGEEARPVVALSEETHTLYLGGEGPERVFTLRDRSGRVVARKLLKDPEVEKWREELMGQCGP
jgi:hypothetical protein